MVAGILIVTFGLAFALGFLHINTDHVKCFERKHWSSNRWYTIMSAGKLELRYRNFNWDCDTKYNPAEGWKKNDPAGLVPIQ